MNLRIALCATAVAVAATTSLVAWMPAQAENRPPVVVLESATTSVGPISCTRRRPPEHAVRSSSAAGRRGSPTATRRTRSTWESVGRRPHPSGGSTGGLPVRLWLTAIGGRARAPLSSAAGADAGGAPELPAVVRALEVTGSRSGHRMDGGSEGLWRQLRGDARNSGTVAVDNPPMVMAAGKGDVPAAPTTSCCGTLLQGESHLRHPVRAGAAALGSYTIRGRSPAGPLCSWSLQLPVGISWVRAGGRPVVVARGLTACVTLPGRMRAADGDAGPRGGKRRRRLPRGTGGRLVDPVAEPAAAFASDPRGDPVGTRSSSLEGADPGHAAAPSVADDPNHPKVVTQTVGSPLEAVGDRLLTRGEI
jgi:hypothetical protein